MSCRRYSKQIDEIVLGTLSSRKWKRLAQHVHGCVSCTRSYNRAILALRQLHGKPNEVAPEELALVAPASIGLQRDWRRFIGWRAAVGALVTACLVVVVNGLIRTSFRGAGEVGIRGTGVPVFDAEVRAYCLRETSTGELEVLGASSADGHLTCSRGGLVQFAYSLRSDQSAYLYVAGTDEAGRTFDYIPRPPAEQSTEIQPTNAEEPLAGSVRLGVKHQPGHVRVTAAVSPTPLTRAEVMELMRPHRSPSEAQPARLLHLDLEVTP